MIKRFNEEDGLAMVTAILISMVVLTFSIGVLGLSLHNSSASSRDRKRVQGISTAEAGLDATMFQVQSSVIDTAQGNYTLPCTVDAPLSGSPASSYHVEVNYYATYPPTGSPMSCPPHTVPAGATFVSTGTSVAGSGALSVSRTMQSQARLSPVYGSFGQAIFANQDLNLENHLGVSGNVGNDGDLYTNGNFSCTNNSSIAGSILAQGSITMESSCRFNQDLYAKLGITMLNTSSAGHDAISATSSLSMLNNSTISHNVTVATTCTGCTTGSGGRIAGSVTTGHISPAPPARAMPLIDYVPTAWTDAGYQIVTYSSCSTARTAIKTGWVAPTVVRITPACTLGISGDTINMQNNVAIFADGPITFANNNTVQSPGAARILYLIEPTNGITSPNCSATPRDITVNNNTTFVQVYLFAYSQCKVTYANNNSGLGGQVIGGTVDIANLYDLAFKPIVIPGGVVIGFKQDVAFIREIINP